MWGQPRLCHPERSEGPMRFPASCIGPSRPRTPLRMTTLGAAERSSVGFVTLSFAAMAKSLSLSGSGGIRGGRSSVPGRAVFWRVTFLLGTESIVAARALSGSAHGILDDGRDRVCHSRFHSLQAIQKRTYMQSQGGAAEFGWWFPHKELLAVSFRMRVLRQRSSPSTGRTTRTGRRPVEGGFISPELFQSKG